MTKSLPRYLPILKFQEGKLPNEIKLPGTVHEPFGYRDFVSKEAYTLNSEI